MKKQAVAILLVGTIVLGLCACGEKETQAVPTPSTEPTTTVTPTLTPAPTPEPTPAPTLPTVGPSEDGELFQAFLNGEVAAVVGDDFYNSLQYVGVELDHDTWGRIWMGGEVMSIQSLTELVTGSVNTEGIENLSDATVDYAILKTMSGRQMLVMHYVTPAGAEAVTDAALSAHGVDPDTPVIEDWTPWEIKK